MSQAQVQEAQLGPSSRAAMMACLMVSSGTVQTATVGAVGMTHAVDAQGIAMMV